MKKIGLIVICILLFAGFGHGYYSYTINEGGSDYFYSEPSQTNNIVSTQSYDVNVRGSNYNIYY